MATWKAELFVNSRVGRINTEVEASTFSGAKEQIYAKHGNVQQIMNLREVSRRRGSTSSSSSSDVGGTMGLLGLVAVAWAFVTFTPWILMGLGGAAGLWIGEKVTRQSVEEYAGKGNDSGHGKAAIALALSLLAGGFGFVKGDEIKKGFDAPSSPTQVESAK